PVIHHRANGGTCLRGDESLVIKKESDIEPLIVVKK
ncbi:MAG: hypothetical protein ACM685_23840, partial [Enterobacteriaceae bacterium]